MIDSLSFQVFPRIFLLSVASEGLYLLLAYESRIPPGESPLAAWYRPVRFEETVPFLAIWATLFVVYALAIRFVQGRSGRTLVLTIFLTSALFRVTLLAKGSFTKDVPEAFLHGASPLRAVAGVKRGYGALGAVAFDLAGLAISPALLRAASLPTGLALVYGWSPLLVKEGAGSARLECIPLFFVLLAFLLRQKKRPDASALAYGASLAGPPFYWATIPLAARALGARLLVSLVVGAIAWAPLAASRSMTELLRWPPENFVGGSLVPALETLGRLFVTRNPMVALWIAGGAFFLVAVARAFKLRPDGANLPREALVVLGCFLFLSPQVLPWALVPIAGLAPYSANPGWIVLTATAPLTYLALSEGRGGFWLGFAQYFPVYASLVFVSLGTKQGGRRPGKAT